MGPALLDPGESTAVESSVLELQGIVQDTIISQSHAKDTPVERVVFLRS